VGFEVSVADWDSASVAWDGFDLAVVRSPWDYVGRRDELLAWAARVEAVTALANPAAVLEWNTDKRYLGVLAARGVPIVPTTFVGPGSSWTAPTGDVDVVVKPAISAGAADTSRHHDGASAAAHVTALVAAGRTAMVQPYVAAIDSTGETALVYLDGAFSHGLRKGSILAGDTTMVEGLYAEEDISARTPSAEEHALAERVLRATADELGLDTALLYARVDVVPGDDGEPLLLELEVTEPSLYVGHAPGAADRFAAAAARRCGL
jgi:hypothetical protein